MKPLNVNFLSAYRITPARECVLKHMELGKEEHEENHSRKGVRIETCRSLPYTYLRITPARECVLKRSGKKNGTLFRFF